MADLYQTGPSGVTPGSPVALTTPTPTIAATPLPALGPPRFEGDIIHYAPPAPSAATSVSIPGVPNIAGIDARFAAVPAAPTRVSGGFASQGDALEYANQLHAHNQALKDAMQYASIAKSLNDIHHEAAQQIEAGDFLTKYSGLRHDDPDYEQKVSKLFADHPNAGGHPAVAEALQVKHAARENNFNIQNQKRKEDEENDKAIHILGAAGFLVPGDLTQPGEKHPEIGRPTINKDGSPNYTNLLFLGAVRQGTSKNERGENAQQRADRADFEHYTKEITRLESAGEETTPAYTQAKEMLGVLGGRIAQRDYSRLITTRPGATGATGPAPTGTPAPSVSSFLIKRRP